MADVYFSLKLSRDSLTAITNHFQTPPPGISPVGVSEIILQDLGSPGGASEIG